MVAGACGHSSQHNAASSTTPTTNDAQAREDSRASQLCTQAFAASAGTAQGHARPPVDLFEIGDASQVKQRIETLSRDWREGSVPREVDFSLSSNDPDKINTVVCVRIIYIVVGHYQSASGAGSTEAVRQDYDARVVDWHSGEVVASQYFQGPDPPESAKVGTDNEAVVGDEPEDALGSWLHGVLSG
ncbi:hypothetical protein MPRM_12540 [Mycobacterium parmense]|uniref:Uncharacterized protein n=2 Tax=Mycobacterium parmense TaxID=185642 RepID=A0A7I7YSI2_9MYCO|nr:hypothetical protein MPRM_12540 [Mycobacterium parmense]